MAQRRIKSKWKKMMAQIHDAVLNRHIPETVKMSRAALNAMLNRYRMVYIKPDVGSFGDGVGRIEKMGGQYLYRFGVKSKKYKTYSALYQDLQRQLGRTPYLVQQGIHLLKHRGRRFDLRVMVQENLQKQLESTAIIGRVAHPKKIVTNYHSGGKLEPAEKLLSPYLPKTKVSRYILGLKQLGLRAGQAVRRRYPGVKEVGVDIAVDQRLHPWILETNTRPDPHIFKVLKDKSIYRKVVRYARAYGRFQLKPMKRMRILR